MKRIVLVALTSTMIFAVHAREHHHSEPFLMYGMQPEKGGKLPKNFRTFHDELKEKDQSISTQGLANVSGSGSAEFFVEIMPNLIVELRSKLAREITIVDLRRESHCFINNMPFFWYQKPPTDHGIWALYNDEKTGQEVVQDEEKRLAHVIKNKQATVFNLYQETPYKPSFSTFSSIHLNDKTNIKLETAMTEKHLANQHGLHYLRLPIFDGYEPSVEIIDEFLTYFRSHKNNWYHFHCNAGQGRTTTFVAFFDMMHNAKDVDFDSIMKRQTMLGGKDLLKTKGHKTAKKAQRYADRLKTIKSFYDYCKENNDGFKTLYSTWLKKNNTQATHTKVNKKHTVALQ